MPKTTKEIIDTQSKDWSRESKLVAHLNKCWWSEEEIKEKLECLLLEDDTDLYNKLKEFKEGLS